MYNKTVNKTGPETAIEELTWEFIEDGLMSRRQLGKHVLDLNGCWLTVAYLYQDLNRRKGTFERPKVALVRYRKYVGHYKKMGQFNFSLPQTQTVLPVLVRWLQISQQLVDDIDGPQPADPPSYAEGASTAPSSAPASVG